MGDGNEGVECRKFLPIKLDPLPPKNLLTPRKGAALNLLLVNSLNSFGSQFESVPCLWHAFCSKTETRGRAAPLQFPLALFSPDRMSATEVVFPTGADAKHGWTQAAAPVGSAPGKSSRVRVRLSHERSVHSAEVLSKDRLMRFPLPNELIYVKFWQLPPNH